MPPVSVWLIRSSLLNLAAGSLVGAVMLSRYSMPVLSGALRWLPLHLEMLMFGWLLQLVFGVAAWILPRRPVRSRGLGEGALWAAWGLINSGVLLAGLGGLPGAAAALAPAGRGCVLLAAAAFGAHAWPRVRAAGAAMHGR